MKPFVCKLKEYRLAAGFTQEELAARVGARRETIVRLEAGRYNPSLRLAYDISVAVGVPIEDIFLLGERSVEMQVREYHFARPAEAEAGGQVRELPIGRLEETGRGPRFYYVGRFTSPDQVLDFARSHPHLAIYNERGERCGAEQVAQELRGWKTGLSRAGTRAAGTGAPASDWSEWEF